MRKLGEILVEGGAVTAEHVDAALAVQARSGERVGAALIALGAAGDDEVARALAIQYGLPAALVRHLDLRDESVAEVVPAALARSLCALPVAWTRAADGLALVVCFRDPSPEHVAAVERAAGHPIVPAVAGERALARALARTYPAGGVPDQTAAVDVDFDEPSQPRLALDLVDLDDGRVQRDATQIEPPQRTTAAPPSSTLTLDAAAAAMAQADGSDRIADLAIAYARGAWRAAVVLQVRQGLAIGHRGFGGLVTPATLDAISIPLAQPSVLATVHDSRRAYAGQPPPGGLAQTRFLKLFADLGTKPIAVVPIAIGDRVLSLLFAVAPTGPLVESAAALGRLGQAMEAGFARLIREARLLRSRD